MVRFNTSLKVPLADVEVVVVDVKRFHLLLFVSLFSVLSLLLGCWLVAASGGNNGFPAISFLKRGPLQAGSTDGVGANNPVVDNAIQGRAEGKVSAEPTAAPTATAAPAIDLTSVKPNELGTVPILAYHIVCDKNSRWSRSRESFRQDLERFYRAGFRSISLSDFIDNRIDLPAGLSPLVITFDDSSPGQFTFVKDDDSLKPDPNCAVAILEEFARQHPDFGLNATFFVLPAADPPHDLFGQKEYQKQKLEYLVQKGMEIGNHTYWHQQLTNQPDKEVLRQIGQANKILTELVPGYRIRAFALPLDEWPPNRALVISGQWEGVSYKHDAVLLAGSYPAPAPNRNDYNPLAIPRVQALDETLDYWFEKLDADKDMRYVSDGNPDTITFPERLSSKLNPDSIGTKKVVKY